MMPEPPVSYIDLRSVLPRNTANARKWLVRRPLRNIHYWFVHYPDAPAPAPNQPAEVAQLATFARYHCSKDWSSDGSGVFGWAIMYTWAIGPSGTAYLLNDPQDILWNTRDGNGMGAATLVLVGQGEQMTPAQEATLRAHLLYQTSLNYCSASPRSTFGHGECQAIYGGGPPFGNDTRCPGPVLLEWTRNFRKGAQLPGAPNCHYFTETGQSVCHGFLDHYIRDGADISGGVTRYGYPVTGEMQETLEDGRTYTVQYFERARFEWHTEYTPGKVLEGRLGVELLAARHRGTLGEPAIEHSEGAG